MPWERLGLAREQPGGDRHQSDDHGEREVVGKAPGQPMRVHVADPRPHQHAHMRLDDDQRQRSEDEQGDEYAAHSRAAQFAGQRSIRFRTPSACQAARSAEMQRGTWRRFATADRKGLTNVPQADAYICRCFGETAAAPLALRIEHEQIDRITTARNAEGHEDDASLQATAPRFATADATVVGLDVSNVKSGWPDANIPQRSTSIESSTSENSTRLTSLGRRSGSSKANSTARSCRCPARPCTGSSRSRLGRDGPPPRLWCQS